MEKYDVFISYSRANSDIAQQIFECLQGNKINAFFDRETLPNGNFAETITSSIASCKVFVCLLSKESLSSGMFAKEVLFAHNLGKTILPVYLDNVDLSENQTLYSAVGPIQGICISEDEASEQSLDILVEKVKDICDNVSNQSQSTSTEPHPSSERRERKSRGSSSRVKKVFGWGFLSLVVLFLLSAVYLNTLSTSTHDECGSAPTLSGEDESTSTPSDEDESTTIPSDEDGITHHDTVANDDYDTLSPMQSVSMVCVLIGLGVFGYVYFFQRRSYTVILHNALVDKDVKVWVDGEFVSIVKANGVYRLKRRNGQHVIFANCIDEKEGQNIYQNFDKSTNQKIISLSPDKDNGKEKEGRGVGSGLLRYRCFIAGSTSIVKERNTARAALSVLYNQYERYNFAISSYTYEDFKNSFCIEGHQYLYDEFICKKADCAIFLICNKVGLKTVEEYNVAIEAYKKSNPKHPAVFVYNALSDEKDFIEQDPSVIEFHKRVTEEHSYWRNYKDLEDLMLKIKEDINPELMELLIMNPIVRKFQGEQA